MGVLPKNDSYSVCALCERPTSTLTKHHLIPRQVTKRRDLQESDTIAICSACHRQLHALFNNTTLASEVRTLSQLKAIPEMKKFIDWVKKQDPNKLIQVSPTKKKK